jgi:hypothetical protein
MGRVCSTKGAKRNACRILMGNPEGNSLLEDQDFCEWTILTWILGEVEWGGMDWIDLTQDRDLWRPLVNMVTNLRVP